MLKGKPAPPKTESKPPACRAMLGPCWHIFRPRTPFFRSRAHLQPLLAHLERFLVTRSPFFRVLGRSKHDFGGSGQGFGGFETLFSFVFRINEHALPSCSQYNKTAIFVWFCRFRSTAHTATKNVFCVALKAFLDMVPEWLPKIPAGIHFLVFASTLQRGGTCEAHGIRPKCVP